MRNLIILGAGGCGREVLQWAKDINKIQKRWNIKGFLDNDKNCLNNKKCDVGIIGDDDTYVIEPDDDFICAIGNSSIREAIIKKYTERGASIVNIIHPLATVADTCRLGVGCIIYPYASISDNTVIGNGTIINSHSSIGHDSVLGAFCTISAHCDITGWCSLGSRVFMGSTSHIVPNTRIGDDVYVCAGSTVMTRVRQGLKVLGTPAKIIKF